MFDPEMLYESADDGKLKHLEHAEDHVINDGEHGFNHSIHVLDSVHDALLGKKNGAKITTKYDGSPSVVFGHHPENGKFFVASKSAFNKNPKLNYTPEDISRNHPAAEGLRSKLKAALEHLPKVAPKSGVFQGDLMYTKNDVEHDKKAYHFKPNTITYSAHKDSEEGKKIGKAQLGMVVHTRYRGKSFEDMRAHFDPKHEDFADHPDVHMIHPDTDLTKASYSIQHQRGYLGSMQKAVSTYNKIPAHAHEAFDREKEHMATYINAEVRNGKTPTAAGLKKHIQERYEKEAGALKTEKAKEAKHNMMQGHLNNVQSHSAHFDSLFQAHKHIQDAKNRLVDALASHTKFGHSIEGKAAKPEGFVATVKGQPTKLVDRAEFSRANFAGAMARMKK